MTKKRKLSQILSFCLSLTQINLTGTFKEDVRVNKWVINENKSAPDIPSRAWLPTRM